MSQKFFFEGPVYRTVEMLQWSRGNGIPIISVSSHNFAHVYWSSGSLLAIYSSPHWIETRPNFINAFWMRCRPRDYTMLRLRFAEYITPDNEG